MSDSYSQFSECIESLTAEEVDWLNKVLKLSGDDSDEELKALADELGIKIEEIREHDDIDRWPDFTAEIEENKDGDKYLWLASEDHFSETHLIWLVQAFIRRFRTDFIFTVSGAATCSKLRVGEFGGWWLAISKDGTEGGNTWDAAKEAAEKLGKDHEDQV